VGGDGLARGYCNRHDLTAEHFIADPFTAQPGARLYSTGDKVRYLPDGSLQYLGRADQQVKVRGYRIELKEIETVLALHPQVLAAVAPVREDDAENNRLVAYVVAQAVTNPPTPKALRDFARQKLPDYMVPADFFIVDSLPMTPVGKIDRRALPNLSHKRHSETGFLPPSDLLESQLVKIWEDILEVRPIGTEHDFFDLGGHSLLAVRMMDRIEDAYGQRLPLATLFAGATIKHLAECLRAESLSMHGAHIVPVQPEGCHPPFFFLHGGVGLYCRKLARLIGQDQPFYAVISRDWDDDPSLVSVEAMAQENVKHLLAVQSEGPYLLGGYCHGGLIAYEMARQMEQQGLQVGPVILLDAWVPRYFGWLKGLIRFSGWLARLDVDTQTRLSVRGRAILVRAMNARHHGIRAFLQTCLRTARHRFLTVPLRSPASPGTPKTPLDSELLLGDLRYRGLLMNYRPKPYSGRVVMLRTQAAQVSYPADPTAGWGKLAAHVEVQNLPGDHVTCQTDYIGEVAEHIGKCLRDFHQSAEVRLEESRRQ
jgi:thioesterase domain-containing protein/acyl carrier protein